MTRKKIYVTAEDIHNGIRGMKMRCPVALAIIRETGLVGTRVNQKSWSLHGGFNQRLGVSATRFITNFDALMPVEPFTFVTEVPDAS